MKIGKTPGVRYPLSVVSLDVLRLVRPLGLHYNATSDPLDQMPRRLDLEFFIEDAIRHFLGGYSRPAVWR